MKTVLVVITFLSIEQIQSSPFDDGKYHPKVYNYDDSGRYNRPTDEGRYIPGDEGRYTYVYKQGLYPDDDGNYMYIHQVGPNGHGNDPNDRDGPNGPGGSNGPRGSDGESGNIPTWNNYIGRRIYAERYPFVGNIVDEVVDYFINKSRNYVYYDDETGASVPNYNFVEPSDPSCKCKDVDPNEDILDPVEDSPSSFHQPDELHKEGMYYTFQGKRSYREAAESPGSRKTIYYEISIRLIDESVS